MTATAGSQKTVLTAGRHGWWRFLQGLVQVSVCASSVACASLAAEARGRAEEPPQVELRTLEVSGLCEPSAMAWSPWEPGHVLVGDNEVQGQLWDFALEDGWLVHPTTVAMPAQHRPRDIEALAVSRETLWVVGSHGRDARCEPKARRSRIRALRRDAAGELVEHGFLDHARQVQAATEDPTLCRALFANPEDEQVGALCERLAQQSDGSCHRLDVEGAAFVTSVSSTDAGALPVERLWLGLRAPVIEGDAVLLRLAEGDERLFDRLVRVNLHGDGIRELQVDGDVLYAIAGTVGDTGRAHALWRVYLGTLEGEVLPPEFLASLPNSAEGLVVGTPYATFVVDGEQGSGDGCAQPGQQGRVRLDRLNRSPMVPH